MEKCIERCIECNSENLIEEYTDGDIVCGDCGIVNDNVIDHTAEWRNFENDTVSKERCIINENDQILVSNCGEKRMQRNLVRATAEDYTKRKMRTVKDTYEKICEDNGLLKVFAYRASKMYEELFNQKKFDGKKQIKRAKKLKGIKAACLYFVLQNSDEPIYRKTPDEIASITGVDIHNINEAKKEIIKQLNLYDQLSLNNIYTDLIIKYTNELRKMKKINISSDLIHKMKTIMNSATRKGLLLEKVPKSSSVGCIWFVLSHHSNFISSKQITKKDIKDCTGVSSVTLDTVSNTLYQFSLSEK